MIDSEEAYDLTKVGSESSSYVSATIACMDGCLLIWRSKEEGRD